MATCAGAGICDFLWEAPSCVTKAAMVCGGVILVRGFWCMERKSAVRAVLAGGIPMNDL